MQVPRQPKLVVGGFFSDELGDMKAVNPPLFWCEILLNLYESIKGGSPYNRYKWSDNL